MNWKQPKRIESIVFDFDGTLAELRLDFAVMKHRLADLAAEFFRTAPEIPAAPALEWLETLALNLKETGDGAAEEFTARAHSLIVGMELDSAREGALFPFTRSILGELRDMGVKTAVITRNCEDAVRMVFPDVDECCGAFLARNHVPRVKPDPDHLVRALDMISAVLRTALMVGDHPLDIQTGKRAGVLTAGVSTGNASLDELALSGADWTAPDCRALMRLLKAQGFIRAGSRSRPPAEMKAPAP